MLAAGKSKTEGGARDAMRLDVHAICRHNTKCMITQILSGILLSAVSFAFGYFLFRSQTKEQTRLEVYRRRLDTYEKIITFLDHVDTFAHRGFVQSRKDEFEERALNLQTSTALYTSSELHSSLEALWNDIYNLPGSLAELEETDTNIR